MAELWGAIQRGLGAALSGIYDVIPVYGIAIILLTVAVRVLLIPLTLKQIRSMTGLTKIQPQLKEIQQKHKGDREKLNEEMMKLYREHGVNPFGSCLPILAQMPVFIALFTILRAAVPIEVAAAAPVEGEVTVTVASFPGEELSNIVCRPVGAPAGPDTLTVRCLGEREETRPEFRLTGLSLRNGVEQERPPSQMVALCRPFVTEGENVGFTCASALGTGHLPRDSTLFQDINADRASFLGMHLGCTATQVGSRVAARHCTAEEGSAGRFADQIPYYLLIALIVVTSFYQAQQMAKRAKGPAAAQQKMLTRVMPIMFGFISLQLPAGTNVYFLATNVWTIGQQHFVLKKQDRESGEAPKKDKPKDIKEAPPPEPAKPATKGYTPKKGRPTPKRKKRR